LEDVEYTHLGRSGLSVSRQVLGTMNFGPGASEEDSPTIMDRAHEHGINFFDTANVYGSKPGEGVTEQIIGRWFATGGGRRNSGRSANTLAKHRKTVEAYEKGEDPAHVGLAWLLAQDGVTGPISGPRTVEQLDSSLRAPAITLDDATLDTSNGRQDIVRTKGRLRLRRA
jgi:aryl-alcohol dehydrogenase-like predicted oxidoreductase